MPDAFVPLGAWLRPPAPPEAVSPLDAQVADVLEEAPLDESLAACADADELDDALAAARRFRAALDDALDVAVADMLDTIAREVLGRELTLAPTDVRAIVALARERYAFREPLAIRVHADDVAAFGDGERVVADARLQRGDVLLEVRSGTIDATIAARVERLLGAYGAA